MQKAEKMQELRVFAQEIRVETLKTVGSLGFGHVPGAMSVIDALAVLYGEVMKVDPKNPHWEDRDWCVLSKGHAGPAMYATLGLKGFYPIEEAYTLNQPHTNFPSHTDRTKTPGVDLTTGSLGQGMSTATGAALGNKLDGRDSHVFVFVGDGECDEGSNWEAAMSAAHFKVDNVISFVDRNKCMIDGRTEDVMSLVPFADKWRAFGFIVKEVDGHNFNELSEAIDFALENKGAPVMIIANTIKGEGIDFMEDNYLWHYGAIDDEKYAKAKESLDKHYAKRVARAEKEGV